MRLHLVSRPRPEEISNESLEKARDQLIRCNVANATAKIGHSFILQLINEVLRCREEELELAVDTADILDLDDALEALQDDELEELVESDSACLPREKPEPELWNVVAPTRQPLVYRHRDPWLAGDRRILVVAVLLIVIVLCGLALAGCSP